MRRIEQARYGPVGGELRHRRQDLLRLYRAQRRKGPGARHHGWIAGESDLGGPLGHRSNHGRNARGIDGPGLSIRLLVYCITAVPSHFTGSCAANALASRWSAVTNSAFTLTA